MKAIVQREVLFELLGTTSLPKEIKRKPEKAYSILVEKHGDSLRDKLIAAEESVQDRLWHTGILYSNRELSIRGERENKRLLGNKISKTISIAHSVLRKNLDVG